MAPLMRTWLLLALVLAACEKAHHEPPAAGSGSVSAADPLVDGFVADMEAYGANATPILLTFDGDCGALSDKMLALVLARYEAAIPPAKMADVEKQEDDIHDKCHGDAKYEAAMERVGIMMRKRH